mgnify:CR=1 FL=1
MINHANMEREKQHTKIIQSHEFKSKYGNLYVEELSEFFANNNFTDDNKLRMLKFIDRAYDMGYVEALPQFTDTEE